MADGKDLHTFAQARSRLDEIVSEVRKKNLSLEKSLDLYEEAIELGNRCAELVDKADFTEQEALAAAEVLDAPAPDVSLSGARGSEAPASGQPAGEGGSVEAESAE